MKLPARGFAVTASALIALTALGSAPASAASAVPAAGGPNSCPAGDLCLYQNKDFNMNGGTQWSFSYNGTRHDVWVYVGDGANDQATGFINNRVLGSGIAENKIDNFPNNCLDIGGNGGNENSTLGLMNMSGALWENGDKVNDSVSAIMLKSSGYNLCDEQF